MRRCLHGCVAGALVAVSLAACAGPDGDTDGERALDGVVDHGLIVTEVDFGERRIGQEPTPQQALVSNTGERPVEILAMSAPDEQAGFFLGSSLVGDTLDPGEQSSFLVRWLPNRIGTSEGVIFMDTDASLPGDPIRIPARGVAITGSLTVEPGLVRIPGDEDAARVPIVLSNTGRADLSISQVAIEGDAGLGLDLDPSRNGELPLELVPVDPSTGLPTRTVYVTWDRAASDGTSEGRVLLSNDGYLDRTVEVTVVVE